MLLERSSGGCLRALKAFRRYSNRLTPLIVVVLLLSLLYCALCVAIPYYLKGTRHAFLYYLIHPILGFLLLHTCFHYYRLFAPKSPYRRFETQIIRGFVIGSQRGVRMKNPTLHPCSLVTLTGERRDLPVISDYCSSCDDFVIGLYGHATFLGVCIGLHNGRHFLAFLSYGILYSTVAAAITVPLAVQLLWEPSLLYRICYDSHLGPLALLYCYSWSSSQSFMLYYLLSATAALCIAVSLVPVLLLYARFIVNGWSFSASDNRPWISQFDRNFMQKFLRLPDRVQLRTILATMVYPTRFEPCDEFNR